MGDDLEQEIEKQDTEAEVPEKEDAPEPPKVAHDQDTGEATVTLPEPRQSRRERREQRSQRISELEEDNRRLREQAFRQPQAPAPAPVVQQEEVPMAKRLRAALDPLSKQQERIQAQLRMPGLSEADVKVLQEQWYDLDAEKDVKRAEITRPAASKTAPEPSAVDVILRSEFPDAFSNPQVMMHAVGVYNMKKAMLWRDGKEPTLQTQKDAIQESLIAFGVRQSPKAPPSPAQMARHAAVPSQPAARGASGGREVKLSKEHQRMAKARYDKDSEEVAYAKFARMLAAEEKS